MRGNPQSGQEKKFGKTKKSSWQTAQDVLQYKCKEEHLLQNNLPTGSSR
jgi:hypothetical protein